MFHRNNVDHHAINDVVFNLHVPEATIISVATSLNKATSFAQRPWIDRVS